MEKLCVLPIVSMCRSSNRWKSPRIKLLSVSRFNNHM